MSYQNAIELAKELVDKRNKFLQDKIKIFPTNNFRASDIPDCDRAMVYSVLNWRDKARHNERLQAIFDAGNKEEQNVKQRLGYELGFEFIQQQADFEIKNNIGEIMCRGHIDGKILYKGETIPVEIKSMNENIFNSINSLEDFQKKPIHRKYLRQMQLYLFGNNEEAGLFILSNFRHEKIIPVSLDYGECEHILQRIERNWQFVKRKSYPDPIEYKPDICDRCSYSHICLPPRENQESVMIDSEELIASLDKREELKPLVEEYAELDKSIKERFANIDSAFVGTKWQIITTHKIGKRVDTKLIPDEIKKQYEVETERVTTKIINLDKKILTTAEV